MAKTCKKCRMRFEDEKRFEIHKGVHGRYIDPEAEIKAVMKRQ